MDTNSNQIAIIGAGLAGAILANRLINAGFNVTIFEKSRGSGGRIAACRLGDSSADLGAPFLSPASTEFREWLAQQPSMCEWMPMTYDFNGAMRQSQPRLIASPRQSALSRALIKGATLHTSTRVATLSSIHANNREQSAVLLQDENGVHLGCYAAAIVATPAKQATPLLSEIAPHFMQLAAAATPTISWVMVLRLSSTRPNKAELIEGEHPVLLRCIKDSAKPSRNGSQESEIWVLEATPEWSAAQRDSSPSQVAEQLKAAFFALLTCRPKVIEERVHRWLYSRHVVSEINNNLLNSTYSHLGYLWDEKAQVGACGDWLESGDIEGAWLSANKLARVITSR